MSSHIHTHTHTHSKQKRSSWKKKIWVNEIIKLNFILRSRF